MEQMLKHFYVKKNNNCLFSKIYDVGFFVLFLPGLGSEPGIF
jgi:hypothetical protein